MKILFRILILVCLFANCSENKGKQKTNTSNEELKYDTNVIAILPFDEIRPRDQGPEMAAYMINSRPALLNNTELKLIEILIDKSIRQFNSGPNKIKKEMGMSPMTDTSKPYGIIYLENYRRQYTAFYNSKGEKEVIVDCFNEVNIPFIRYWKKERIHVTGGGIHFFHVFINLTAKTYHDFYVHDTC